MINKIISGNWKMNGSINDIETWFDSFFSKVEEFERNNNKKTPDAIICLPFLYIPFAQELAKKYNKTTKQIKLFIGAEDCHYENNGAFTGNISPLMLKEYNVKYVIVGHSERREFEKEINSLVAKKSINAINNGLSPILCIGESLEIRESKKYLDFIEKQVLESIDGVDLTKIVIAYEPIWAIGTGKVPTLEEIKEIILCVKTILSRKSGLNKDEINILYGGSVKSTNVEEIMSIESVSGVLVGGASLKGEEFFKILTSSL